jgi:DNA helicase II / ATP-dependent DNA helicase PcrA
MNLFDQLNPPQLEAVNTHQGPLLVLAGAGSGKTRVVTHRIISLIQQGIPPSQILGLTFTNKAAAEMKERINHLTQSHVLICTFHSLGVRILRESIQALGYKKDFSIYDESDSDTVLNYCLQDLGIYDSKKGNKAYKKLISQTKNNMEMPDEAEAADDLPQFPLAYAKYQAKLQEYNALDFDDLLFLTVRLFKEHPEILAAYQKRWQYLLIDEYQDTNEAQYTMVKCLAGEKCNICVVGDPDQSIYSWRGAKIRNILNFEKDFPGAKIIRLEQNYRSRTNILNAANAVIRTNAGRFEKHLWSDKGPGEKIKHFVADDGLAEAEFVANRMLHHYECHQIPLSQMVVFYRTNAQSRVFEDCFLKWRLPYVIVGGLSFYQRREIKDILAFLRMVQASNDFVAFERTINIPKRGIGDTTLEKIRLNAAQSNQSILNYCHSIVFDPQSTSAPIKLSLKQKEGIKEYLGIIYQLSRINQACSLKQLVETAISASGYMGYLQEDKETFEDRKANLDALIAKAMEWEGVTEEPSLEKFLEELSLKSTLDETTEKKEHASLMTIHNGKGLEFALTFLVGIEEDLFPHINSKGSDDKIEEERRLFYVGMTRAKEFLYISNTLSRFVWGTSRTPWPSRFLREIPPEYIEKIRLSHNKSQTKFKNL